MSTKLWSRKQREYACSMVQEVYDYLLPDKASTCRYEEIQISVVEMIHALAMKVKAMEEANERKP